MRYDPTPSPDDGLYRHVFEASRDGIVVLDAGAAPWQANRAARDLFAGDLDPLLRALRTPGGDLAAFRQELAAKGHAAAELRLPQGPAKAQRVSVHGQRLGSRDVLFLRD